MTLLDQPRPVRPGEELPLDRLSGYLRERLPGLPPAQPLEVTQFPHGHSNLTYLLRAGHRELVLRRPPFGAAIKSAHDMGREYRILSHLRAVYPKVPEALLYCDDPAVLGAPFYIMQRVTGFVLRARPPQELGPSHMRTLSQALLDNLIAIHALDYAAAGLGELGRPEGYVARQVAGWTERYFNARTDDFPAVEQAARWLAEHRPLESGAALIHNDYKYDNLVYDPDDLSHIIAVLDWEMATVGDPLMDFGTTLGYWAGPGDPPGLIDSAFGPTALPGNLSRRELVERYARASGRDLSRIQFYYVYGLFKIAVIVQQIYARYRRGDTHDPRFAGLIGRVGLLGEAAASAIAHGEASL